MGIPEKLVMERTGHRSLASLHYYQHPSEKLREMVRDIVTGTNKTDEEDVKPSLKMKRMPCKQQESDDSEDDNVDKAKSSKRMRVFSFSNCKVVIG
jgi:hypothetical protein